MGHQIHPPILDLIFLFDDLRLPSILETFGRDNELCKISRPTLFKIVPSSLCADFCGPNLHRKETSSAPTWTPAHSRSTL